MKRRSLLLSDGCRGAVLVSRAGCDKKNQLQFFMPGLLTGSAGAHRRWGGDSSAGARLNMPGRPSGTAVPRDAQIIDGKGKSVAAGFGDMHVHLQGAWDGISVDLLGYQRYLNAMLNAGITRFWTRVIISLGCCSCGRRCASGHLLGPRIYCTGAMIDAADPAWPDLAYALTSRAQNPPEICGSATTG